MNRRYSGRHVWQQNLRRRYSGRHVSQRRDQLGYAHIATFIGWLLKQN